MTQDTTNPPDQLSQAPERQSPGQPMTLLGVMERLLAGAAVLGAGIYVLMNSLYVDFYDDFGVRPEDVGWDRLAILGRAGLVALVVIFVGYVAGGLYAATRIRQGRAEAHDLRWQLNSLNNKPAEERLRVATEKRKSLEVKYVRVRRRNRNHAYTALIGLLIVPTLIGGYYLLDVEVEREAARASHGQSVNGLGFIAPFIDVRAERADVTWLGEEDRKPQGIDAPHLMYLGRSRDIVVLLACGETTLQVPADDVMVRIRDQGRSEITHQDQVADFNRLCPPDRRSP